MKESNSVVIIGSSRKDGDTASVVKSLSKQGDFDIINLQDFNIDYYDYDHRNKKDDFLSLMTDLIGQYEVFVFATPVYWYSMSAIMKTFIDRFSDLITIEKELGRKLKGKSIAVLSCSIGGAKENSLFQPFVKTADYLGMHYVGGRHFDEIGNVQVERAFIELINGGDEW